MKNTAIKLSGILLAGAVFFSTLLGYGTQVAAATAIGSDTEAGQASGDGSVASVADLPGKHIGVQLGTTGDIMVSDYETDGSGTVVERYNKGADAVQALKQGKLDCVIIDELPALAFVEQNEGLKILEENFVEEDYAFVIAKGNEALVDQVNETLRELKDEGVLDNIAKNYTGTDEEIGKYPYEILDVERTNGTLTVGTNAEFPPYEYYDGDAIVGIDVEVAQAIADKLGMELEVTDIAFDSIIPGVQTGKYDMGMAGMTVTDERKEQVNFSDSYATGVQVVIVKDDSPITSVDDLFADGASTVVGTQAGTTGFIYATSDIEDAGLGTVKSFGKTTDAVEALKNGQVDCVILDNEPAKALVAANEGLHILDTEYAVEDYAIAIAKENTDLLEKVNKALAEMTDDGTLQSIVDKYISADSAAQ